MKESVDVSVIMINYNTYDLAKAALESMFSFTAKLRLQVIVIDNASHDGSGEKIKNFFGDKILFLQAEENLGTSKAFNRALKFANGKYVLWLNPDVVFVEDFIGKLFRFTEANPACGVCGGNLIDKDGKPCHSFRKKIVSLNTIKRDNSLFMHLFNKIFKKCLSEEFNYTGKVKEVGYITGADMFVRREIFEIIGAFDEDIFMYAEETEFQFRVKKLTDYKIYSVPSAKLIHLEGQSFKGSDFSERRHRLTIKGTSVFIEKSYGKDAAIKYLERIIKDYRKFITVFWFWKSKREIYKVKLKNAKELKEELKKGNL